MAEQEPTRQETHRARTERQSWVWMVIALVSVVALIAWLAFESQRIQREIAIMEEEMAAAEEEEDEVDDEEVAWAELEGISADPQSFLGREVRVEDLEVSSVLGPRAFWANVPDGSPMLVLVGPDLTEEPDVQMGDTLHVRGYIGAVTDSAVSEWVASQALHPEAVEQVTFATHYIFGERAIARRDRNGPEDEEGEDA